MKDICIVNVNTNAELTNRMVETAQAKGAPSMNIFGLTPVFGGGSVNNYHEAYLSSVGVMDVIRRYEGSIDAVVLGGFGEPGREGLEELLGVPVIDICEASLAFSSLLGRRPVILTNEASGEGVDPAWDRVILAGYADKVGGVASVGLSLDELTSKPDAALAATVETGRRMVEQHGGDVIVLGCAALCGLADQASAALGVPVLDGIEVSIRVLEDFNQLGLVQGFARKKVNLAPLIWPG